MKLTIEEVLNDEYEIQYYANLSKAESIHLLDLLQTPYEEVNIDWREMRASAEVDFNLETDAGQHHQIKGTAKYLVSGHPACYGTDPADDIDADTEFYLDWDDSDLSLYMFGGNIPFSIVLHDDTNA